MRGEARLLDLHPRERGSLELDVQLGVQARLLGLPIGIERWWL